ncbi:Monocarboxylate Transporter 12 [Manis pentadactyla]|nr:Monocarboxylate Transporter 12 [Manis pentadactyla]
MKGVSWEINRRLRTTFPSTAYSLAGEGGGGSLSCRPLLQPSSLIASFGFLLLSPDAVTEHTGQALGL